MTAVKTAGKPATSAANMTTPTIGFIGLGNMGVPMVRCLIKAGYPVMAFDLRVEVAEALAAESAKPPKASKAAKAGKVVKVPGKVHAASTLAELGEGSDIVITMLPDSAIVRAVVIGTKAKRGLAAHLKAGSVVIDMSSSYPLDTRLLADALATRQVAVIDAPVSGGVGKAVTGTLAIMAGGDATVLDTVAPVLSAMGQLHRTGALGSGHAIKALNNYVSAAGLIATCEALSIAESFGLDLATVTATINASTGRNNTTENKAARYLIPRSYTSGFALALMEKDVGMARTLAADLGLDPQALAFVSDYLGKAKVTLGPDADHTAVMALIPPPKRKKAAI